MTASSPARSASTAKPTRSPTSGVGCSVWFSLRMSSSLGVTVGPASRPPGSGRTDPDRKLPQAVGEVRPDPERPAGEFEGCDASGQGGQDDPDLQSGQMGAQAQVRPAAAEAEVPVGGAGNVEPVRVGELGLVPVPR